MATKKKVDTTTMVRICKKVHKKVKAEVKNTRTSIGEYFETAAEEKLNTKLKSINSSKK